MAEDNRYQHYEVLRREDGSLWELGRGANGITYKAFDTNLRFPVALKVINNFNLNSELARQRFLREAQAAAKLRHPNVAALFHIGTDDHGNYFCAMEFIEGETVDAYIKREGPLSPVEALGITLQVSRALVAAAKQLLVHRDLKPANLMLVDEEGEKVVKVIDFGLAKSVKRGGEDSGTLTVGGGFVGTPQFASPEQLEEGDIDTRSDIYSLGATLYYMIAGRPPYSGSVAQIMSQHLYKPVPTGPLHGYPAPVVNLILSMMEKDRDNRPQDPTELRQRIQNCLQEFVCDPCPPLPELSFSSPAPLTLLDENIQFTVYRPREITPVRWYKMLIFTHLDERPEWLDANERSPLEQVEDEAQRILGPGLETYRKTTDESRLAVPREGEIILVPEMQGIEFNPRTRSFSWKDSLCVHLETFELRARPDFVAPTVVRGRVTIFLGHLILAEITLSIRVSQSRAPAALTRVPSESSSARRFRRIFASYSHRDLEIVKEMERYSLSLGDRYLRDWVDLRAGERWDERLLGMITEADIFQLFWSWNSSQSPYVEREWRHALSLRRETFIRPTYWEDPWPGPPEPLRPIQFQRLEIVRLPERQGRRLLAEVPSRRQTQELERLEAERRQTQELERLETERRQKQEQERLEAERRQKQERERLEAERPQKKLPIDDHLLSGLLAKSREALIRWFVEPRVRLVLALGFAVFLGIGSYLIYRSFPPPPPPAVGDLAVETDPPGAAITLDGGASLKAPHTFNQVKFGSHRLTATLEGYFPTQQDLQFNGAKPPKIVLKPDADVMNNLGVMYANGSGRAQDYAKARECFQKAAEAGNVEAMINLGDLYAKGEGVARDLAKAREWYQKAAAIGNKK